MHHKSLFPDLPKVPESNIHHLLFDRPEQKEWPDYTLFVDVDTGLQRSFREFVERVRDGATALGTDVAQGGLGLCSENGEIVGILSENCLDFVALVHSLLAITVPLVMFSSYATPYEFERANSLAQPTRIFASPSLLPLALTSGLPPDRIYLLEGEDKSHTSYDQLVSSVRKNNIPRVPVRHATKDTLAFMMFSSGTSGLPKVIMMSHGNITHGVLGFMLLSTEAGKVQGPSLWKTSEGIQVAFSVAPICYALGFYSTIIFTLLRHSTVAVLPKWNIDVFFNSITKYKIANLFLFPSLVHQIVHHPRFKTVDFSSVKSISSGGAHLTPQLTEQLYSRFQNIKGVVNGAFGMSESATAVTVVPIPGMLNGRAKVKPGSCGILAPGMEARIVRPDGSLTGPNEAGEIHIRGAGISMGYKGNDKVTRETFVDGWMRTGDRIRVDEDQVFFFEDRMKDTLKVSGMQVAPVEIEDTLLAQPDGLIADVAVAGVSGGRTSDERIPRAWVVLSPAGIALGEKEVVLRLSMWMQERLSRYKWLRGGFGVMKAIPKSPTGKVLRRVLVGEYEGEVKPRPKL